MRGLLSVLLVIACPPILMAGAAGTSESDPAKSAVEASAPSASMNSNGKEEKAPAEKAVEKPVPPVANPDVVQHDPTAPKEEKPVEQTSSPPAEDAAEGKRGDETAAASELQTGNAAPQETRGLTDTICLILESAAAANGLPLEFFARVIWQESRFDPNAIGPTTRTGHRAQGIAQFMPYTATERGLLNPLDPERALPEAAEFLAELRREFGNLGLAAAAYNAGPGRVRDFINGRDSLPAQTRHYVRAITGRSVEEWTARGRETGKDGIVRPTSCRFLTALLKEPPAFSIGPIERKLREAASRPGGIPDGRNASVGQSLTKRVTAGPTARTARHKQVDTASLPTTAARPSSGRSAASADSKRSSGAPASSIKQTVARTRADLKLASVRLRIVSPKSIAQDVSTARGLHSRESMAAQNSRAVRVRTASLSSGGAARQPKVNPSVASVGSRSSSEALTEARKSTATSSRPSSTASTLRESKAAPARLRMVTPNKITRERSTRVAALRANTAGRTTADRVAEHRKIAAAVTESSRLSGTRVKLMGQSVTSAVSTRSESRPVRGVARNPTVKASEDRVKKVMQICRGC